MKRLLAALAAGASLIVLTPMPGAAQVVVHDPTAYARMLEDARNALDQLRALQAQVQQGEALLDSLNAASGVNSLAGILQRVDVRSPLPDLDALTAAARGDLDALTRIGARARALRDQAHGGAQGDHRLSTADAFYRQALARATDHAARDQASGEAVIEAAQNRQAGLATLQQALDDAPNARAVLDLSARLAVEQALIANERNQLEGLALMREGEAALEAQRLNARRSAAREARLRLYETAWR